MTQFGILTYTPERPTTTFWANFDTKRKLDSTPVRLVTVSFWRRHFQSSYSLPQCSLLSSCVTDCNFNVVRCPCNGRICEVSPSTSQWHYVTLHSWVSLYPGTPRGYFQSENSDSVMARTCMRYLRYKTAIRQSESSRDLNLGVESTRDCQFVTVIVLGRN